MSKRMYHPCHKLSVPSAKIFWCRHCMQMFEDAISRWHHSRTCKERSKLKVKDVNGKVIQMYVKPDKVSYTSNIVPGQQLVIHKPQLKRETELKCFICQHKFFSIDQMREHVRFPCNRPIVDARIDWDSDESDIDSNVELDNQCPVPFKINRDQVAENISCSSPNINISTSLSVLAEASKHVESLSSQETYRYTDIPQKHAFEEYVTPPPVSAYSPNSAPADGFAPDLLSQYEPAPVETVVVTQGSERLEHRSASVSVDQLDPVENSDTRGDITEPVVIVAQQEGPPDVPILLDFHTIQTCVRDIVSTLPIGQLVQVQLGDNLTVHYTAGAEGAIIPLGATLQPETVQVNQFNPYNTK